ncbi:MAG: adenylate/guanylate cyclase domain-containing protein [Bacteroidota bacterium]
MKYKTVLLWAILFSVNNLIAQAPSAEVFQVNELLEEAKQLSIKDSAVLVAERALEISLNEQYEEGTILSYQLLADLHNDQNDFVESLRSLLQLIPILEKNEDLTSLHDAFLQVGNIYLKERLHEQALNYFQKAEKLSAPKTDIVALEKMELTYAYAGFPDSALLLLDQIYDYHEEADNYIGKANALERRTDNHLAKKDYRASLKSNQDLLELATSQGNDREIAIAYNNIAYNYIKLNNYQQAIDNFTMAQTINDGKDEREDVTLSINMAICYHNLGDSDNAINYLRSVETMLPNDAFVRQCQVNQLISSVHLNQGDFYNAQFYNDKSMTQAKNINSAVELSESYRQAGKIHEALYEFEEALEYYTLHLRLEDSLRTVEKLRQQQLLQQQLELERTEKEIRIYQINEELKDAQLQRSEEERKRLELQRDQLAFEAREREDQLALLEKDKKLQETLTRAKERESQQALLLIQQRLETEARDREFSELQQQEQLQRLQLEQARADEQLQEQKIQALTRQKQMNELSAANQRKSTQLAYGIGIALAIISLLVFITLFRARRNNKRLSQKNNEVEKERALAEAERKKSDALLLNILPEPTAIELKEKGSATPKKYERATVLFTDFSGFTNISAQLSPEQLIQELNDCFTAFDEIIERYGLEKIKTIGDGYMCVGGIPIPDQNNPHNAVQAAIEMQAFMDKNIERKIKEGIPHWQMRVGIHTGNLVAGVVGSKKFAYDVWGDTVNVASRMESAGESGKINISKATYEIIKDHFDCTYRGAFEVKNKGEVEMYFVEA